MNEHTTIPRKIKKPFGMPAIKRLNWMSEIHDEKKLSEIAIPGRMSLK